MNLYPLILSSSDRSKGFTLVEVLVAVTIFSLAIASIYGVFASISGTKDKLDSNSETFHQARVVFDRIGREIQGIYRHSDDDLSVLEGGLSEEGHVFLELSTTAASFVADGDSGFVSVRYELIIDSESDDGRYVLLRTEKPLLSLQDVLPMQFATGIKDFNLRYFSNDSWSQQWNYEQQGFPEFLEVSLVGFDKGGEEISFVTAFKFPSVGS